MHQFSKSSRGDDTDLRSGSRIEQAQRHSKGASFNEDIKAQLMGCMNNENYMHWQGLRQSSQANIKDKHKFKELNTDFKRGIIKNLAGLIGKGVIE